MMIVSGFPPAEASSTTRGHFGSTNFFGGPAETTVKIREHGYLKTCAPAIKKKYILEKKNIFFFNTTEFKKKINWNWSNVNVYEINLIC